MGITEDFGYFWLLYPRKVGKLAAQKLYERARKSGVTHQQIMDGVTAYIQHKPEYADWAYPKTWLSQGRWDDDYTPVEVKKPARVPAAYRAYVPLRLREDSNG